MQFTEEEDIQLLEGVKEYGLRWTRISKVIGKSMIKCHKRFMQLTGAEGDHAQKVTWTAYEDEILKKQVAIHGTKKWHKVCEALPTRIHKQCRERWFNKLDPSLVKKRWTDAEDWQILQLYR